jgi:hypothetical protein
VEIGYWIAVSFKSNERPWNGTYRPPNQPGDDADAIDWACGMRDNLPDYVVTLYRGAINIPLPEQCSECGINTADPPSSLCPGCQAYKDHQA